MVTWGYTVIYMFMKYTCLWRFWSLVLPWQPPRPSHQYAIRHLDCQASVSTIEGTGFLDFWKQHTYSLQSYSINAKKRWNDHPPSSTIIHHHPPSYSLMKKNPPNPVSIPFPPLKDFKRLQTPQFPIRIVRRGQQARSIRGRSWQCHHLPGREMEHVAGRTHVLRHLAMKWFRRWPM
jgi:hypothetical protein